MPESVFLSSEIQATDSTCTGCSAKIAAAIHAPGTRSSDRIRPSKSAEPACRMMFVR
jgi:hypothetical protein